MERYSSVALLLDSEKPVEPVYCIYPHVCRDTARQFLDGFPGRVLYAVKACSEPAIIREFIAEGMTSFDCASLPEVEIVKSVSMDTDCYFMVPVRLRGEARTAQEKYGVRHFVLDHVDGVPPLASEIDMTRSVVFARMAIHHASALYDLSHKFGAPPEEIPALIDAIVAAGAEPALAFNVGSGVRNPDAYEDAIAIAAEVLKSIPHKIRLVDIGGGYPRSYPGYRMPDLSAYFERIRSSTKMLPMADGGEILGEPGRAMAAPGMSAISEVLARKEDRLYINDGMHGIFWELRYEGHTSFPFRVYRDGKPLTGVTREFSLFGPTCDSEDILPAKLALPADIRPGDYLEFGRLGAYSISGRTNFNGRYSDRIVLIDNPDELPPGHHEYSN